MTGLLYREDYDAVRDRLTNWWNGADIGRPAMLLTAPRERPLEDIPALPRPRGWVTDYSTRDYAYRLNLTQRACVNTHYLGETLPKVAPDLAPGCVALYLGCHGVETDGTVWMEPCIDDPDTARFAFDPDNRYWQFTLRLARDQLRLAKGKFALEFPDLIEGLDTLASMRGTEQLLFDLVDRPDWVREALDHLNTLYFAYYDPLYELIKDDRGGSIFWCWAPGRMAKLQCDCSAMISVASFRDFMLPVLRNLTQRLDYCMYHWDGPGAIQHHDALLELPRLNMLQWTPGDGHEPVADRRWWPLFHKTIEAGKKVYIGGLNLDDLRSLRREFGHRLNQFLLGVSCKSLDDADRAMQIVSA